MLKIQFSSAEHFTPFATTGQFTSQNTKVFKTPLATKPTNATNVLQTYFSGL